MRRRDHARVDADRRRRADAHEPLVLQEAQEVRLRLERQVADLVEEDGAAFRALQAALAALMSAGERALLVAEQLRLNQTGGQRAAVDRHERPAPARRMVVDRAGDELLAGTAFAADQHRRIDAHDLVECAIDLQHSRAPPHHPITAGRLGLALRQPLDERRPAERVADDDEQPVEVERQRVEIVKSFDNRLRDLGHVERRLRHERDPLDPVHRGDCAQRGHRPGSGLVEHCEPDAITVESSDTRGGSGDVADQFHFPAGADQRCGEFQR